MSVADVRKLLQRSFLFQLRMVIKFAGIHVKEILRVL